MQASIEMQPMRHSNPRADTPTTAQGGGTHSPFVRTSQQVVQGVVAVSNQAVTHTQNAVIGQAFYQFPNATPENASERFNVKLKSYFDTEGEWRNSMTSKKQEFTKLFHRIIDKLKEKQPEHWHLLVTQPDFINHNISDLHILHNDNSNQIKKVVFSSLPVGSVAIAAGAIMNVLAGVKHDLEFLSPIGYGVEAVGGGIVATAMTRVKYNNYKRTNDTINNIVNRYVQQNNTVPDGAVAVNMGIDNNGVANGVPARMQPVADGVPVAIMTNNIPLPAEELPVPNPSGLQRV